MLSWLILSVSVSKNHGHLVYALDDAYIGMAMARNFSQYGVWGVTRYAFTSCSSPPLWTLLLSLTYYLGGVNQLAPLLWDLAFAILVLAAADAIFSWYKAPAGVRLVALLGIILMSLVNNFAGATFRKALTVPCCTASHFAGAFLR